MNIIDGVEKITLTSIRVLLGIFWISQLIWKVPPDFGCPNGFCFWVKQELEHPLIPLYTQTAIALVNSDPYVFGWITDILETGIGVFLLLGVYTKWIGLIGALWALNLLIGLAQVPGENPWFYIFLISLNFLYFSVGDKFQLSITRMKK